MLIYQVYVYVQSTFNSHINYIPTTRKNKKILQNQNLQVYIGTLCNTTVRWKIYIIKRKEYYIYRVASLYTSDFTIIIIIIIINAQSMYIQNYNHKKVVKIYTFSNNFKRTHTKYKVHIKKKKIESSPTFSLSIIWYIEWFGSVFQNINHQMEK